MVFRCDDGQPLTVRRWDVGTLGDLERTPQGGFRIPALPTRVGVFPYMLPDGTIRRELRPAEEVFAPDSLATLAHAPVTDLHPEKEGIRIPVTPDNYKELSVGHVAEDVRPNVDHVAATLVIQDQGMIQKIEQGVRRECSAGYNCVLDPTSGVTDQGEVYDAIQRQIRYNHVALGPRDWGRAGSTVALRLDSGDAIQAPQKDEPVENEIIDGVSYKVGSPEWRTAIQAQRAKITAERDQAQGRADTAEKALTAAKAAVPDPKLEQAAIQRRVRLVLDCKRAAFVAKVKFDDDAAASTDEQSLIVEAIKLLDPSFDPKGRTPDYLAGVFQTLIKGLGSDEAAEQAAGQDAKGAPQTPPPGTPPGTAPPAPAQKTDAAPRTIFGARQGGPAPQEHADSGPDPDKAREAMTKRNRDAWKTPLNAAK